LMITDVFTGAVAALAGVAVTIEGVRVGGKKGVGGLFPEGWKNQPLQEASRKPEIKISGILFISSPPSLYPAQEKRAKPAGLQSRFNRGCSSTLPPYVLLLYNCPLSPHASNFI